MNIKAILGLASVGLLLTTIYFQNEAINKLKTEKVQSKDMQYLDSLRAELFQVQSEKGKLEIGLDHLKEIDSVEYNQVEEYITNETE